MSGPALLPDPNSTDLLCEIFKISSLNNNKINTLQALTLQGERDMYVYIESEPGLWTVGFYSPDGEWHPESDHEVREDAAKRVSWLNGHV